MSNALKASFVRRKARPVHIELRGFANRTKLRAQHTAVKAQPQLPAPSNSQLPRGTREGRPAQAHPLQTREEEPHNNSQEAEKGTRRREATRDMQPM